jgi:hypothetical protein
MVGKVGEIGNSSGRMCRVTYKMPSCIVRDGTAGATR